MTEREDCENQEPSDTNLELCPMCNENLVESGICFDCEETINRLDTADYMKSNEGYRITVGFSIMHRAYYQDDDE